MAALGFRDAGIAEFIVMWPPEDRLALLERAAATIASLRERQAQSRSAIQEPSTADGRYALTKDAGVTHVWWLARRALHVKTAAQQTDGRLLQMLTH